VPSGHLVFARQGSLWAQRFDLNRLEAVGQEVVVLQALEVGAFSVPYTFSRDGLLAYMPGETGLVLGAGGAPRTLVWVDSAGREEALPLPIRQYEGPELSPDGRRVAVSVAEGTSTDLWVYDVTNGASLRLTRNGTFAWKSPIWSPDGQRIYFGEASPATGAVDVYSVPADGSGDPEQMLSTETSDHPAGVSPDGSTLIFRRVFADGPADVIAVRLQGEPAETRVLGGDFVSGNASMSPDGRWLAYFSDESGQREVYIQPYPGPGPKTPVSIGGGQEVRWSDDGSELYYRNGQSIMAVSVQTGSTLSVGQPRPLLADDYRNGFAINGTREYDVAPDGRFLMMREGIVDPDADPDQYDHLVLVDNWFDELRRLVPED
jgi:dipeptidyl aminopeptidase/acylaminoacyl peptidase